VTANTRFLIHLAAVAVPAFAWLACALFVAQAALLAAVVWWMS